MVEPTGGCRSPGFPFTSGRRRGRMASNALQRQLPGTLRRRRRLAGVRRSPGATTRRDLNMGAMAEAFVAYAQPLLDQTDGSDEQLNKAFAISQLCYNLALLPEDQRDTMLDEMRQDLRMDDGEFADFRRSVIDPMIRRHEEMFPGMPGSVSLTRRRVPPLRRPTRERRRPAKSIPAPIAMHRVPAAAARSTSSVAAQSADDSRPGAGKGATRMSDPLRPLPALSGVARRRGCERPPGHRAPGAGTDRAGRSRHGCTRPGRRRRGARCGPGSAGRAHR